MPRMPIRELWAEAVLTTPLSIDWREALGDDLDGFTCYEAAECSQCGKAVVTVNQFGEEQHCDICEEETTCQGYLVAEGPMMNYAYPLGNNLRHSPEEAARLLKDLPLCLVERDGEWFLALTGGGMDLRWEIIEAFMLLGFLPPLHFVAPPAMAGKSLNARNRWILAGCRASARWTARFARRRLQDVARLKSSLERRAEKVAA
jgi:hypothetical protein